MAFGFFNKKKPLEIDMDNLPNHIAVIMDGNGRWAKSRMMPRAVGHRQGMEVLKDIIRYASDIGLKHMTFYAFSTENWKRPIDEVNVLMDILVSYLRSEVDELNSKNVKINFIGFIDELGELQKNEIYGAMDKTKENTGLNVHFAVNYGGRDEIVNAVRLIAEKVKSSELLVEDITKENFGKYLFTNGIPDPDLLIRTSGEKRLSNFLLWQLSYSEFYFADIHWPEFNKVELNKAIAVFQQRNRRFGGV